MANVGANLADTEDRDKVASDLGLGGGFRRIFRFPHPLDIHHLAAI